MRVRIVLAEEDVMIGEKWKEYFKECWAQDKCGRGIEGVYSEQGLLQGFDRPGLTTVHQGSISNR